MAHTSREPATKVYGVPYPWIEPSPASRIHLQFFNLKPGEFWEPDLEADLLAPKILLPIAEPRQWRIINETWNIRLHWQPLKNYIICSRRITSWAYAFLFHFYYGKHQWCMNEILTPAGYFSYGGSCNITWVDL